MISIDLQLQFVMVWQQFRTIAVAVEISNVVKERETVTRTVIANQACFVANTILNINGEPDQFRC